MAAIGSIVMGMSAQTQSFQEQLAKSQAVIGKLAKEAKASASKVEELTKQIEEAKIDKLAQDAQAGAGEVGELAQSLEWAADEAYAAQLDMALLATETGKLDQVSKKGASTTEKLGNAISAAANKAKQLGVILAGAAGAAGAALAALGVSAAQRLNEQGKFADSVGTTASKFDELQRAVQKTRGDVDAVGPALTTLRQTLSEAATVASPAQEALAKLGLSAAAMEKMDTGAAFEEIAKSLSNIKDPSERAALAMQVMGNDAGKLMSTLSDGALAKAQGDMKGLGTSASEADRNGVQNAVASFAGMQKAVDSIGNTIAVTFAPMVELVVNKLSEWAKASGLAGDSTKEGMSKASGAVSKVVDAMQWLNRVFKTVQIGVTKVIKGIADSVGWLLRQVEKAINLIPGMKVSFADFTNAFSDELANVIKTQQDELAKMGTETSWSAQFSKGLDEVRKKNEQTAAAMRKTGQAATDLAGKIDEGKSLWDQTRTPLEKYQIELQKIDALLKKGAISEEVARRARVQSAISAGMNETKFAGGNLTRNSTDARSAILQANNRDRMGIGDVQRSTAATATYTQSCAQSLQALLTRADRQQEEAWNL